MNYKGPESTMGQNYRENTSVNMSFNSFGLQAQNLNALNKGF